MNKVDNLYGCKNLEDLKGFLDNLSPRISPLGGRYFKKSGEQRLYRQDEIVRCFQKIYTRTTPEKGSIDLSKKILSQIKGLDKASKAELSKKNILVRIIAFAREFFGNLFFDSHSVLKNIGKSISRNADKPKFPAPTIPSNDKKKKRVRFAEKVEVLEFDDDDNSGKKSIKTIPLTDQHPHVQRVKRSIPLTTPTPPAKKIERSFPPLGATDTIMFVKGKGFVSIHGQGNMFHNDEILQIHKAVGQEEIKDDKRPGAPPIYAKKTKTGKYVIQQQATRGCTAATAAMLIMDHGKQPDITELLTRNLGHKKDQVRDIEKAGLKPIVSKDFDLDTLKLLLEQHGSAIVTIDDEELGGHVIVVDEITDEGVHLRDPYHGWEITVTLEAFDKRFASEYAIQIESPAA